MKKRILGITAAVLLAVVGTVLLVGYVKNAESRALAGEEVVDVFVVGEPIAQGTASLDIEDNIRVEQVPKKVAIEGAVDDLEDIDGLVAARDLLPGEQVTRSRFVEKTSVSVYARSIEAPEGLLEVTVALDPERVIGGSLTPGNKVAVVGSFEPFQIAGIVLPENFDTRLTKAELDELEKIYFIDNRLITGDETANTSHILKHKVLVTHVQEEEKPPQSLTDEGEEVITGTGLAPTGKLLVTLAVDAPTLERFVFTQEFGSIWLAVEPDDASEDGTKIVNRGNVYDDADAADDEDGSDE